MKLATKRKEITIALLLYISYVNVHQHICMCQVQISDESCREILSISPTVC